MNVGEHDRRVGDHVPHILAVGTDGRVRTDTGGGLSAVPLPVLGYVSMVDRAGVEPATFSLQGSCASGCATGPLVAGAGIEPAGRGVWALADLQIPRFDGVTGRT